MDCVKAEKSDDRMKKKKMLFILNPHSGKGLIKNKLLAILDIFVQQGYRVEIYPTQSAGEAREMTAKRGGKYDLVVCSGGDGTLDEVVGGMMRSRKRVPIGYIPAGSTNDFANSLKLPRDMIKAAQVAVEGCEFPCDVGNMNGLYFVYVAAFGLFTDVSYDTPQEWKNLLGHAAYMLGGVKSLTSIKSYHMRVTCNGETIEDDFIFGMVTNSTSVGGFKGMTGKDVLLDDGLFEVTMIRSPKNPLELGEIVASLTNRADETNLVFSAKADLVEIVSQEDVPWTMDGEFGGSHSKVLIRNERQAVTLMCGNSSAIAALGENGMG